MTKKKNEKITKEENKESFFYKYKNDKKYKAKVELTGYVALILFVILFINVANLGSNNTTSNNNLTSENTNTNTNINEEQVEEDLLKKINNNYQYDINISLTKNTEEITNYHYYGKSYDNTLEINKEFNETTNTYYKVDDYYYKKSEEDYILATTEEIYDIISNNYIELDKLLGYIEESSLDHVTNYSSGKKESVYTLYLRDIIINNQTEDTVTINVVEENEILSVSVDYTNLIKVSDDTIKECTVNYTFNNIDKIEEFFTINESEENLGDINE